MKTLLALLVFLLYSTEASAIKMGLSTQQGRKISQLYTELSKGEHTKVLAESLAELKSFGSKSMSSFSDLPYRMALAEVALFAAKDYDPKLPKYFSTFMKSAQYFKETELAAQHTETLSQGLKAEKVQYKNALSVMDQISDPKLDLGKEYLKKRLAPLEKAIAEKTLFEKVDIEAARDYAEFSTKNLTGNLRDHNLEMRSELDALFANAHKADQTENAIQIRELQIATSPPGKDRAKAKLRLWHLYRSMGQAEKGLTYLNCDKPNVMSEKATSPADAYEIRAQCYQAVARTISGLYDTVAMRNLYQKLKKIEPQLIKVAGEEGQYYFYLTKFELERALLNTPSAKASYEKIRNSDFNSKGKFLMGPCDKAIELYSIFESENLDVGACITDLEKAIAEDAENISHYAFALRNLSQHYRLTNNLEKSHFYAAKALEITDKNLPDHGVLKHVVYITAAQSYFINKKPNDALTTIEKARASVKGTKLENKLAKFISLHEELFTRKKAKAEFVKEITLLYGGDPFLRKQVDTLAAHI